MVWEHTCGYCVWKGKISETPSNLICIHSELIKSDPLDFTSSFKEINIVSVNGAWLIPFTETRTIRIRALGRFEISLGRESFYLLMFYLSVILLNTETQLKQPKFWTLSNLPFLVDWWQEISFIRHFIRQSRCSWNIVYSLAKTKQKK